MAHRPPAIIIIARHGPRLDAADSSWHLSTPTPYDPPLTYGGWNQSQALGARIANVLHAREKAANEQVIEEENARAGIQTKDFSTIACGPGGAEAHLNQPSRRSRRLKHKIVIHTSPFLRCVQTSVGIAAGIAQHSPISNDAGHSSRPRTPMSLHSASPKLKAQDHVLKSSYLAPITEPLRNDSAVLESLPPPVKMKLRVDAFLGEWLNPQYFENITPPPPSAMMVATAKAELLLNDQIDVYTPTISSKSSMSTLWGGSVVGSTTNGALEDMSGLQQALPAPSNTLRDRANSVSSAASTDSDSSRSPRRTGHVTRPSWSSIASTPDTSTYQAPKPHYAISSSDQIPRGYVAHARRACMDVDYHWDSSKAPQNWVDGGTYGEEWSSMHRRFRKGLNHLMEWYSQGDVNGQSAMPPTKENSPNAKEEAEREDEHEDEDLVVVLVTHGAGCNALIGALTGQPVLLDIGMASMTMAVRREDIPAGRNSSGSSTTNGPHATTNGWLRRPSVDLGLSGLYEMRIVSSTEHLRSDSSRPVQRANARSSLPAFVENSWNRSEPPLRRSTSTAVGSIRRPSAVNLFAPRPDLTTRSDSAPAGNQESAAHDESRTPTPVSRGLWTPPASRAPTSEVQVQKAAGNGDDSVRTNLESSMSQSAFRPPDRRYSPSNAHAVIDEEDTLPSVPVAKGALALALNGTLDHRSTSAMVDSPIEDENLKRLSAIGIPRPSDELPQQLRRGLSQKGLWGARPAGDIVPRHFGQEAKRRWTMTRNAA